MISQVGRRGFLWQSLLLVLIGGYQRLGAQRAPLLRFRPLPQPALVPLADLATRGRARQFVVDAVTLPSAAKPNQPIRITGMVLRATLGDDTPDRFRAVCVRCPHEGCDVDFVPDPGRLPDEVKGEIGHEVTDPVYLCPCHNSTFKSEDGERLAGPAPRGLYRFQVTSVSGSAIEIGQVEEDVLIFS
jgi:Rieske Fe-S protein